MQDLYIHCHGYKSKTSELPPYSLRFYHLELSGYPENVRKKYAKACQTKRKIRTEDRYELSAVQAVNEEILVPTERKKSEDI